MRQWVNARMGKARLTALIAALAIAGVGAQVFRGGVDLVSLNVTVTDADGHLVPGLDKTAFHVYEDGIEQDLTFFARGTQPIALALLLDTSTSMDKKLPVAQEAVVGFAKRLGANDVAEVIDFDNRVQILQGFTGDGARIEQAVRKTEAGGSTSLYNAILVGLDELKRNKAKAPEEIRRQAVVLLSDGEDTTSLVGYEEVLEAAKRSEVTVYAIGLRSKNDQPLHGFNEAEFVLRTLSQQTGGRLFTVDQVAQLPAVYQQIADEIANQYVMGYTSKNPKRDGAWRTIVVRPAAAGATARAKRGYFAATIPK
jgi:Ca-activated chloride channel family protein